MRRVADVFLEMLQSALAERIGNFGQLVGWDGGTEAFGSKL
jgi:hypothetical protein